MSTVRVTALDIETGDSETHEIMDDYVIVTAGTCEVTHIQQFPQTGTVILTVKGRRDRGSDLSVRRDA